MRLTRENRSTKYKSQCCTFNLPNTQFLSHRQHSALPLERTIN